MNQQSDAETRTRTRRGPAAQPRPDSRWILRSLTTAAFVAMVFSFAQTAHAQSTPQPWTPEQLSAMVTPCRQAILRGAYGDYRKRRNLPPATAEETDAAIAKALEQGPGALEPALVLCNCTIGRIATRWDFVYAVAHPDEIQQFVAQLMTTDCKPPEDPRTP